MKLNTGDIKACPHGQYQYCQLCKQYDGKHPCEARKAARPTMYQHLRCTNDNSGNPRRVYVFYNSAGEIVAVHDEGYAGKPDACGGLVGLPSIETYPAVRRALLKEYPHLAKAS